MSCTLVPTTSSYCCGGYILDGVKLTCTSGGGPFNNAACSGSGKSASQHSVPTVMMVIFVGVFAAAITMAI